MFAQNLYFLARNSPSFSRTPPSLRTADETCTKAWGKMGRTLSSAGSQPYHEPLLPIVNNLIPFQAINNHFKPETIINHSHSQPSYGEG